MCDKGFIWNPSNCECECDKLCDVGEYFDYKNCNCKKRLIDKLVEECNESIDGNKMLHNSVLFNPIFTLFWKCLGVILYICSNSRV